MKKFIMVFIGSLLFLAGYNYTRRQAEYTATQSTLENPARVKKPVVIPFKTLPAFVFRDKSFLSSSRLQ